MPFSFNNLFLLSRKTETQWPLIHSTFNSSLNYNDKKILESKANFVRKLKKDTVQLYVVQW